MANALQGLLSTKPFASAIIEDKIAVGGHSFGGFTALGLCGTIPERFDPRIKAVVLLSSNSSGLFYTPEERRVVSMPVMLFIGEHERNNILGSRRVADWAETILSDLPHPKYLLEIKGATHASFSSGYELETHPASTPAISKRHRVISEYVSAFVHKHILGSKKAEERLQTKHPLLTRYLIPPTNS
jgi:predicted dienelactone hydrolase